MEYQITHKTTYRYYQQVSLCHNVARLLLRDTPEQICKTAKIDISPLPDIIKQYFDFYGNKVIYFAIQKEHQELTVNITSRVIKIGRYTANFQDILWEQITGEIMLSKGDAKEACQYIWPTSMTHSNAEIEEYASVSFKKGIGFYEATKDLMGRIFSDFTFTSGLTTVATPLQLVMKERKGVCQDFAHLAIACIRSKGLPVRYISGYIETSPPPGEEKLFGVDASHAWFSIYLPNQGWFDFDPTNNTIPGHQHLTIGWGRDYADITPQKGVILSSGPHQLYVSVDVRKVSD